MIATTRREALMGALAAPALAGWPTMAWARGEDALLLHDASLEAGRRFAEAGRLQGRRVLAIEGDRIRFARAVFESGPALVMGVSRPVDALLIEDVGREAGYRPVSSERLQQMMEAGQPLDPGLTLGWALGR